MESSQVLPRPDSVRALAEVEAFRGSGLHSLYCLRLTLEDIAATWQQDSVHDIVEEFPFASKSIVLSNPPLSPPKPRPCLDLTELAENMEAQLETAMALYKGRIQWLSSGSRLKFGRVKGSKVVLLIDTSNEHCHGDKPRIGDCVHAVRELMREQLTDREVVYLMEFGSKTDPVDPSPLPFATSTESCCKVASDWLNSLEGSGSCNVLKALETAFNLSEVDCIIIVASTKPDQCLEPVLDYVVDRQAGNGGTHRLHLVALESSSETASYLERLANGTEGGHYHRFSSAKEGDGQGAEALVEDTEIKVFKEEIAKAQSLLNSLRSLRSGSVTATTMTTFREVSLSVEWTPKPDLSTSSTHHVTDEGSLVCRAEEWIDQYGVTVRGLNLYHLLAPNAYPQLEGFVASIDRTAVSEVYDVMPLFPWYDGSRKYLHVDVPQLEEYASRVQGHIEGRVRERVGWLLSGSRVPFGAITEERVVLVLDCSLVLLPHTITLQHHLRMLLGDQLAHSQEFNLIRFGKDCCAWSDGLVDTTEESLQDALEWVMGMTPGGTCNLLSALKEVFENGTCVPGNGSSGEEDSLGIYVVVSALPDQDAVHLVSYIEQKLSGLEGLVSLHVTFYNTEPCTEGVGLVIPGQHGGRYGSEEEVAACLRQLAQAGGGNFHHFRVNSSTVESDDITAMLEEVMESSFYLQTAKDVLSGYRDFCRRNISLPEVEKEAAHKTSPPPFYPRQTAASLARLNIVSQKIQTKWFPNRPRAPKCPLRRIKAHSFYLDRGLRKGTITDIEEKVPPSVKVKNKPLIPSREEYLTTAEWLAKYGLEKLQLGFTNLRPTGKHRKSYKHIGNKGQLVELSVSRHGLKSYVKKLQFVMKRYQARLDWLMSDDHKYFGTILDETVVFVMDVSSSMSPHFEELRAAMKILLQSRPPRLKRFALLAYGASLAKWRDGLTSVTTSNCQDAVQWLQSLRSGGSSCLLKALRESLLIGPEAASIYLITDGAADHTHEFLLSQLPLLRKSFGGSWRINTVAFHCRKEQSQDFLKSLASRTDGRYHCFPADIGERTMVLCSHLTSVQRSTPSAATDMSTDIAELLKESLLAQTSLNKAQVLL